MSSYSHRVEPSTLRLADIASVRQGHPFRGAIAEVSDGPVRVIQLKNVTASGLHEPHALLRTRLRPRKEPEWVRHEDVLLTARGNRPVAALLCSPPPDTVCTPHLYVIRVTSTCTVLPAFLAWQLNQPPAQEQLRRQSAGSRQKSVRKIAVEQLVLRLPPLAQQRRIVAIARAAQLECSRLEALIAARRQEIAAVTARLL
ncbi:MAG: restriction endonuclease subunit S [Stenotrophomonas sp.]|uniref:restriction endonuclease subunit S n=1 Tax=Stenotrophomonas sp. TaxID=69392 RepID=UPI003D6D1883